MTATPPIWDACSVPCTFCCSSPEKLSATSAVLTTCDMPTPIPRTALMTRISPNDVVTNAGINPPARKQTAPAAAIIFFGTYSISFPTIRVVGMIAKHGTEIRFWIIVCDASGKLAPIVASALVIPITPIISSAIAYILILILLFALLISFSFPSSAALFVFYLTISFMLLSYLIIFVKSLSIIFKIKFILLL